MLSSRVTVNCSLLFQEVPLLERPAAVRDVGLGAVEFWWPFAQAVPRDHEVDGFVAAIEDAGVALTGLNFFAGDMPAGDRGILSAPGRESEFRDSVATALEIGRRLDCRLFNALYGNRLEGVAASEQDDVAAANLGYAAIEAERMGGTVLVEPVSGAALYPLRTAAEAIAVIDRAGSGGGSIALLADLYHLAANGDDVEAVIARHTDRIAHVQIADLPGRHQPGTGTLPVRRLLAALDAAGYTGRFGLEYLPDGPSAQSFTWLAELDATVPLAGQEGSRA